MKKILELYKKICTSGSPRPETIVSALPILPSAALSSVSGGTTLLPSSLQADKIFSTATIVSDWMEH